jgi:hypothetical protein
MENLSRILSIALLEEQESDVTGLVFAVLGEAGKDYLNGYLVRAEHHLNMGIADITIEVIRGSEKILVVECKKNPQLFKRGEIQLKGYMFSGYPNGLLICGQLSNFYTLEMGVDPLLEPNFSSSYNNSLQISEVIDRIRLM